MTISMPDPRWAEYKAEPTPNDYKGFSIKGGLKYHDTTGTVKITFTDGEHDVTAGAHNKEEAYKEVFDKIDEITTD